jgi:hypothetical protein
MLLILQVLFSGASISVTLSTTASDGQDLALFGHTNQQGSMPSRTCVSNGAQCSTSGRQLIHTAVLSRVSCFQNRVGVNGRQVSGEVARWAADYAQTPAS